MTISLTATARIPQRAIEVNISKAAGETPGQIVRSTLYGEREARVAWLLQTDLSWVAYDYEAPLDVEVSYRIGSAWSNSATLPSDGRDWWISLGAPALTRPINIHSFPGLNRKLGVSLVQPLIRRNPIPVISARRGATGTLTVITLDLDSARGMNSLIEAAPLLMLNGPPAHGFEQGQYLLILDYDELRWTRNAAEPARLFACQVQEVDRPPLDVQVPKQNTWAEWLADPEGTYAGWRVRTHLDVLTEEGVP